MLCDIEKKRSLLNTNFLQDKFSLQVRKLALSSSKEAPIKVLKPPLSTLEVYKERSSVENYF
jgi:hypothetical protein